MDVAQAETQRQLGIIERQVAARAERLTITDRAKRRHNGRGASSWTNADERLFQEHISELTLARRGEIDASRASSIGRRRRLPSFGRAFAFPLRSVEEAEVRTIEA